jgi:hypothetical protein
MSARSKCSAHWRRNSAEFIADLAIPVGEKGKARDAFGRYNEFLNASIGVVFKGEALSKR